MLAKHEDQLGGVLLDMAHVVELQLRKTDGPPLRPGIRDGPLCLLVCQREQGGVALLARGDEIGVQLFSGIGPFRRRFGGVEHPVGKGSGRSEFVLRHGRKVQVELDKRMKGDVPELREPRRELWWRGSAPEALPPQRVGAGQRGVVEHVNGRAKLRPQGGAPRGFHVLSSRDGSRAGQGDSMFRAGRVAGLVARATAGRPYTALLVRDGLGRIFE